MPKSRPDFLNPSKAFVRSLNGIKAGGMKFEKTRLNEVFEIEIQPVYDERGFFARSWCQGEFDKHNLNSRLVQSSISSSPRKGTLRGLHYQSDPFAETKLVRCTKGSMFVVAIDLRPHSSTFKDWIGLVLSATNRKMLYVPEGCAQGFLTLEDDTEVFYQMSEFYHPELTRGVRWNDPAFGVAWPGEVHVISPKDREYPDFI